MFMARGLSFCMVINLRFKVKFFFFYYERSHRSNCISFRYVMEEMSSISSSFHSNIL